MYTGLSLECHWLTHCTLGYHWATRRILAWYTGTPLEKRSWNNPTLECHWRNLVENAPHWDATGETLCKLSLYLEFTALQWIPALLLTHMNTSTSLCACLWYEHHYSFVYLGLQVKWNQLSSNNSHHTSCMHKGLHAGEWTDPMTFKPDSVNTLGDHWTDHPGRPLEPQVHWDATGTTLADASIQWCPSGDRVLICLIGTYWNTTGGPLEDHWKHTGNTLAINNSFSNGITVYTGV